MIINSNINDWITKSEPLLVKSFFHLAFANGGNTVMISYREIALRLGVTRKVGRRIITSLSSDGVIASESTKSGVKICFPKYITPDGANKASSFSRDEGAKHHINAEDLQNTEATSPGLVLRDEEKFKVPSLKDAISYAQDFIQRHNFTLDAPFIVQKWDAYNTMKGWKIKGKDMSDWKASLRYWILNDIQKHNKNGNDTVFARNNTEALRICAKYVY